MAPPVRRGEALASRRAERLGRHARRLDALSSRIAVLRLVLGLALAVTALVAWRMPSRRSPALLTGAVLAAAFAASVSAHARVHRRFRLARGVEAGARRDAQRAAGAWRELPRTGEHLASAGREADLAADLALTGPGSLFQLVSRCATPWGERRLAELLLSAAPAPDLEERQDAVRRLAPRSAFRRRLEAEGESASGDLPGAAALAARLAAPSWIDGRPWVAPLGAALATVTIAQVLLVLAGLPALLGPTLLVNVALSAWLSSRLLPDYEPLLDREATISACARVLRLVERGAGSSALARRWRGRLTEHGSASAALHRLGGLIGALELRRNAFWWPVQAFVLWDSWQAARLARWKRVHGAHAEDWLRVLADAEACCSLAGHAEIFGGCFGEIGDGEPPLRAEALAHPLLPPGKAVANDVELDGDGRVLLLTGSNMSGKSTLLRAAGLNAVLALAGGPSLAARLRMRPCLVLTSIRVTDALDEGVSLFYAEVRRLKTIVAASERFAAGEGLPVLFLVDEILRGTNTRERHAASRAIVARLAATGSAGIVTSHDIELTSLQGSAPGVRNGHFREQVHEGRMTFDYRLRPGPVTSTNALAILRLEGLHVPDA